jgi:serine protease Do
MDPGSSVNLKVLRDGRMQDMAVTLGEFPSKEEQASVQSGNQEGGLGLSVESLTPEMARELKLPASTQGVVVDQVKAGSRAEEAGLQRGDVIQQVNHRPVTDAQEFSQMVRNSQSDTPVLLLVNRSGDTMFLAA